MSISVSPNNTNSGSGDSGADDSGYGTSEVKLVSLVLLLSLSAIIYVL